MDDHLDLDPPVAAVLTAAAAPAEAPLPGEARAMAAFRAAHRPARKLRLLRPAENLKFFAAALGGGVVMVSGVAAAATGSLPLVGSSHSHHSHAPTVQTPGAKTGDGSDQGTGGSSDPGGAGQGQGSTISKLATTTAPTDVPKGQTICTAASQDKCQAGQHGKAGTTTQGKASPAPTPPAHGKSATATHGTAVQPTPHAQPTTPTRNARSSAPGSVNR